MAQKPHRVQARGKGLTLEGILDMYRGITGREPTPEEIAKAKETMAKADAKLAKMQAGR